MIGARTKVTVVKNKIAPPFRKVEFDILFDQGISKEGDLLDLGTTNGALLKSGTWISYKHPTEGEIRLGQGREKARTFLIENPELMAEITKAVMAKAMAIITAKAADAPAPPAPAPAPAVSTPASAPAANTIPAMKPVPKPPTPTPAPAAVGAK